MNVSIAIVTMCLSISTLVGAGCGKARHDTSKPEPRTEDMSKGNVEVTFTVEPPNVQLDRDNLLIIRIAAPPEIEVAPPSLDDRFQGFRLGSGVIDEEPVTRDGKVTRERRALLTPVLSPEYRIAPMAITYTDRSRSPAESGWFPTRPLVFSPAPPIAGKADKDVKDVFSPLWIYPAAKTVLLYVMLALLLAAVAVIAWKLLKKVRRTIQLMRMSPRERALHDLAELLAKDLVAKNQVKEFYLELTLIVRQYIERAHAIRAPEQTTEEFLTAVSRAPQFKPDVVRKLQSFLEAADLVKFAAYHPAPDAIDRAAGTAREYVETDADEPVTPKQGEVT